MALAETLHRPDSNLVLLVTAPEGTRVDDAGAVAAGRDAVRRLADTPGVTVLGDYWSAPKAAADGLRSTALTVPLTLALLVVVFASVVAGMLPLLVGGIASRDSDAPTGSYVSGRQVAPGRPDLSAGAAAGLRVVTTLEPHSDAAQALVSDARAVPAPGERLVGGPSAELVDTLASIADRLPLAGGLIALTTFVLLFLFTGSVVLPVKALVLNAATIVSVVGAMVWVFQEGHLSGVLGFTPSPLAVTMPLLMFCVAFGLSMDYEVFLLGRIKEQHDAGADTATAVAVGLERTGRIVTTAAALLAITFFAFVSSRVSFIQMFGLGTGLAVVLDATLVRGVLAPSLMRLMGSANWWAPRPLRRLHARIGLSETDPGTRIFSRSGR